MKNLLLVLALLNITFITAQVKAPLKEKVTPEKKTFKVKKGSSIKLTQADNIYFDYAITKGNKLVFDYNFKAKDREMVADDEYRERIVFELESKTKSFVLTGDSLLAAKAYYTRSCFCLNRGNFKINGGSIKGKLIKANNWKVDLDLIITPTPERGGDPFSVKVSGIYKLSNPK
jgi:hypothetical protein